MALSVNPKKTKIMIFRKRPSHQDQHHSFKLDNMLLEHTQNYTYLGININNKGNFNKAVNDLRDKARRAFYAIKRNIKIDIPIRIWIKIIKSVIELTENKNSARPNQIIKTQKEKYLKHWRDATALQSKLECYLALNREYELAGYLSTVRDPKLRKVLSMYRLSHRNLTIETDRHRQTWLPKEDRLCPHCTGNEVETELHFLTSCPKYAQIRDSFYPHFTTHHKDFHQKPNMDKLPYLLGESPASSNLAARYVRSCHDERASSGTELPTHSLQVYA